MEYLFFVKGSTITDMFCGFDSFKPHYALFIIFVINPNKCYSRGYTCTYYKFDVGCWPCIRISSSEKVLSNSADGLRCPHMPEDTFRKAQLIQQQW